MSRQIDETKPFSDEDKAWLHSWSQDWKIEENERRFGDHDKADKPPLNLPESIVIPPAPANPTFVDGSPLQPPVIVPVPNGDEAVEPEPSFDEAAVRDVLSEYNVEEIKAELKERDLPLGGNKDILTDRLVDALRKESEEEAEGE